MVNLSGSTVLVTGGTGSLAKALVGPLILSGVHSIRLFSRGEHAQEEMARDMKPWAKSLRFLIGNVCDLDRLLFATDGADYVIHTAAYKTVVACEQNFLEAVEVNINGSSNVVKAAIRRKVRKVVGISTDKACAPVTAYGSTKAAMEHLFRCANGYSSGRTLLSCTRNGNVVGSRGSLLPLLRSQRASGVVTVTDPRMSRFWLPIEHAVETVFFALEESRGGETFIRKAPSMRVLDLVEAVAPDCRVTEIGLRAQEKLAEELVVREEARRTRDAGDYYVVEPESPTWAYEPHENWPLVDENFVYVSNKNPWRVTKEELKAYA